MAYGEALIDVDVDRIEMVRDLSLDETLFMLECRWWTQSWSTQITGARSGRVFWNMPQRVAELPYMLQASRPGRSGPDRHDRRTYSVMAAGRGSSTKEPAMSRAPADSPEIGAR